MMATTQVVLVLVGLSMILVGLRVVRREPDTPPDPPAHDGRAILSNPDLLNYLKRCAKPAPTDPLEVARILKGRVIELPDGLLVSRCRPSSRHREVMGCWSWYAAPTCEADKMQEASHG